MESQAQGHDMCVVFTEFQGRSILRQGVQVHAEEIHCEFAVDVVELIFILAEIFFKVLLIHFSEVVEIVRAFGVDALMEDKVSAFFFGDEGISTVRAAQLYGRETAFGRRKPCSTDLTEELPFGTVIPVKERFRGITAWAGAVVRDIAFRAAADRADHLAITFFVVRDKLFISPVLTEVGDPRESVDLELLVFWGMGVIKSPLFERDISADKD